MLDRNSTAYINSVDYQTLEPKLKQLHEIIDDLTNKTESSRKLRYAEVDIEAEREAGRLAPDEVYVPLHICDTNIRREQGPYVQYITQSPRAVILEDLDDSAFDLALLERDLTKRIRYQGWQLPMFANIDGFQANGYGIMEVVQDQNAPGEVSYEYIQYCDFAFISDTRDIQAVEMTARAYYFTRTRLVALCGDGTKPDEDWDRGQVEKILSKDPESNQSIESSDVKDKSLFRVYKYCFRIDGTIHVGWGMPVTCDAWIRKPRPLFIGRRKQQEKQINPMMKMMLMAAKKPIPTEWVNQYEINFPYILFPYLISENDTIAQLKGRVFLDQDLQEAASSLLSAILTKARRSAGLYFSKDTSDPNDDLALQKNIFLRNGSLINAKIQAFELAAPDPGLFSAINLLMAANQNETSQVSFATNNRKDSRKTAEEIKTAKQAEQVLSTVQVVLFSIALTQLYRMMADVIKSRVLSGLIQNIPQNIIALYNRNYIVKPSGDVDVIEKQETIQKMMNAWPVVQNTPMAEIFLMDLLSLMFPERIAKYQAALDQAKQQQQSQQAQQQQQLMAIAKQMADGIRELSKHQEFFSESGKMYALPAVRMASEKLDQMEKQLTQNGQSRPQIAA